MITAQPGGLIHGTMRPEDLIPFFMDTLASLNPDAHSTLKKDYSDLLQYMTEHPDELPPVGDPLFDDVGFLLEALFDELDFVSPKGYSFGAHVGDGADYGWWPDEGDEEWDDDSGSGTS